MVGVRNSTQHRLLIALGFRVWFFVLLALPALAFGASSLSARSVEPLADAVERSPVDLHGDAEARAGLDFGAESEESERERDGDHAAAGLNGHGIEWTADARCAGPAFVAGGFTAKQLEATGGLHNRGPPAA